MKRLHSSKWKFPSYFKIFSLYCHVYQKVQLCKGCTHLNGKFFGWIQFISVSHIQYFLAQRKKQLFNFTARLNGTCTFIFSYILVWICEFTPLISKLEISLYLSLLFYSIWNWEVAVLRSAISVQGDLHYLSENRHMVCSILSFVPHKFRHFYGSVYRCFFDLKPW